jgi:hypothetical protein
MKNKYGSCWVVVSITLMIFMTCSYVAAENKVVVIPLPNSSAKNASVNVYDDDNQYLGQFVGNNGKWLEILVPTTGKILAIMREGGALMSSSGYWYYKDAACTDGPYLRMVYTPSGANLGILFSNNEPNCDFFGAHPIVSMVSTMESRKGQNGAGVCGTFHDDALFSPITTYTNAEVGFTAPVNSPLQFRTE